MNNMFFEYKSAFEIKIQHKLPLHGNMYCLKYSFQNHM